MTSRSASFSTIRHEAPAMAVGCVAPSTPCIKLCWLDPATGLCQGCGRTLDEIGRWASLDEAARRAIMRVLPERLAVSRGAAVRDEAAP